jgi:hypothetical protein
MKKLIDKALKDFERRKNIPTLDNILTVGGFLKYFKHRNTMPFIRDISYMVINIVQVIAILNVLGIRAASGGVIGYAFMLFISDIWGALKYSLREKIIISEQSAKTHEISKYFLSLIVIGTSIWLIVSLLALNIINTESIGSRDGYIIFVATILSMIFQLISSSYFITAYTISRVFLPLQYTLGSRILNLILGIVLMKFIGVYGICFSFFSSRIVDLLITKHFCDKTLRARNINLRPKNIRAKEIYKKALELLKPASMSIKRILVFTVVSIDKLILILLVHHYYKSYVVDFFLMYQLVNIFMLIPARVSKSMYYDTVMLLKTKSMSMMKLLFNRNLGILIVLGIIFASLFSLLPMINIPHKHWSSMLLDLTIIDQWKWVYVLIFFSFITRFINRLLLFSESYITLLVSYLFFEYALLIYVLLTNSYFMKTKEILVFFPIKGQISIYYAGTLLLIYISGIWKRESSLLNIDSAKNKDVLVEYRSFKDKIREASHNDKIIILILEKTYLGPTFVNQVLGTATSKLNVSSATRISSNTLILISANRDTSVDDLKLKAIELLSAYCKELIVSTKYDILDYFTERTEKSSTNPYRSIINIIYPKLFSHKHDIQKNGLDINATINLLKTNNMAHTLYEINSDFGSSYLKNRIKAKNKLSQVFHFIKDFESKGYQKIDSRLVDLSKLGLITVIQNGDIKAFISVDEAEKNQETMREIIRNLLYLDLLRLLRAHDEWLET